MVLTAGSMPAKACTPHSMHQKAGYARTVAGGSGKLGFSRAIAETPFCHNKSKAVHRCNPEKSGIEHSILKMVDEQV